MEGTRAATGQIVPMGTETVRKEETQTPAMVQHTVHMPLEVVRVKKKRRSILGQAVQVIFRALTALCMIPAVILMVLRNEEIEIVDNRYVIHASYRSSPAFVYLVLGAGVAGCYSILGIALAFCSPRNRFLHTLDMMVLSLAMSAWSSAASVSYIGFYGNEDLAWGKVCPYVKKFCLSSRFSLSLSFFGSIFHFLVCTLSSA
ncbi:CASP-like protein 1C2 [Asparagus officinalis]|uniref:CASP-like protein 1C2 n=1 Tax=Asparagus officinalis TaxID=4686 RepID=UPI00098DF375|nr:CASP-like protein 1C2 [Asparagus officinalis]